MRGFKGFQLYCGYLIVPEALVIIAPTKEAALEAVRKEKGGMTTIQPKDEGRVPRGPILLTGSEGGGSPLKYYVKEVTLLGP